MNTTLRSEIDRINVELQWSLDNYRTEINIPLMPTLLLSYIVAIPLFISLGVLSEFPRSAFVPDFHLHSFFHAYSNL